MSSSNRALNIINKYFSRKVESLNGYSMRAFARDLDVSPSFISRLLKGQKAIPVRLVPKVIEILDIEFEEAMVIKNSLVPDELSSDAQNKKLDKSLSDSGWSLGLRAQEKILNKWFYVAILELTTCSNFDGKVKTISKRLGISEDATNAAVRDLVRLDVLEEKNGKVTKRHSKLRFGSNTSKSTIRNYHKQMLNRAYTELKSKISDEEFEKRLITGITVSAPPEKVAQAKKMLSETLHEIADFLMEEPGTEVYQISGQLFPLSHSNDS